MIKQIDKLDYAINMIDLIVGDYHSVGETNHDNIAISNFETLCDIVEVLLQDILTERDYLEGAYEFSKRQAEEVANTHLSVFMQMLQENEVS